MKKFPAIFPAIRLAAFFVILVLPVHSLKSCTWIHDSIQTSKVINARPVTPFSIPSKNPDRGYLQFMVIGDVGTGGKGQRDVAEAMAQKASEDSVAFVLMLGDNFYESGVESVTDEQWKTKFEDMYWQPSLQVPFYAVLGNHDYHLNPQAQVDYTSLSTRWRMPDRYYTFSYEVDETTEVQIFCLDTDPLANVSHQKLHALAETSTPMQQLRWFEEAVSASRADWKIVIGHHTIYSAGMHGDNQNLIASLEPLFLKYGVDLYICGHDHHQELLKPIKGIHYIVEGSGGKHRDVTWRENTVYARTNLGFSFFRISSDELVTAFYNRKGVLQYAHVIKK